MVSMDFIALLYITGSIVYGYYLYKHYQKPHTERFDAVELYWIPFIIYLIVGINYIIGK